MIPAVSLLCLIAGAIAIPVNTDYYPKSQGYGGHGINGGIVGINDNGFESSILGFNGGNSAAAAAASAASGLNSAAAAAAAAVNAATGGSRHFGQQGVIGFNNGFDAGFGFNGGNSAAAAAAAAASGMNSAAAAAAAAASSAQRSSLTGFQGHSGHHLIGSNYGPFVQQVPSVQFPAVQQFNGLQGSAAAAAAAAAGQQSAVAAAAAAGRNAAAAAAAAAGRDAAAAAAAAAGQNAAAAAAAASASGANFGSQIGIGGSQFVGQIGGQFVQPAAHYPNVPFFGQNSGAAATAAAAASNNAAAASAAAASASSANGFNGGIIGGSTGVIGSRFVPGKKY